MEDIKFRFWNTRKEWWEFWTWDDLKTIMSFNITEDCIEDKMKVQQYIWLKDKNWRYIYEWDILRWNFRVSVNWKSDLKLWKVIWYNLWWHIGFWFKSDLKIPIYNISAKTIMVKNYLDKYEVIWNIYENISIVNTEL